MSAFYGTVEGSAQTSASRRGHQQIKVAAQSWNGSVVTRLFYNKDELYVELQMSDESATTGYTLFYGSVEELKTRLKGETICG